MTCCPRGLCLTLLIFACCILQARAQSDSIDVFILAGQSNMVGQGHTEELPDSLRRAPGTVTFFPDGRRSSLFEGNRFGPEITFAQTIAEARPDQTIFLVKYAVGGTSLLAWASDWSEKRAALTENADAGPLYRKLLRSVRQVTNGNPTRVVGLLWMQGERDARFPDAGREYESHFRTFIRQLRQDLDAPNLPVVFGQVNPPPERYPAAESVREAQKTISAEMSFAKMVSTEGLSKHDDHLHYDTRGQLELGRRMARAYLQFVNRY